MGHTNRCSPSPTHGEGEARTLIADDRSSGAPLDRKLRIALVTEELAFGRGSGGTGGAFHELSLALARAGHTVDIIHVPIDLGAQNPDLQEYYRAHDINIVRPELSRFVWSIQDYPSRSYAIFRHMYGLDRPYDFIHFHDYKGLGYATLCARQQHLAFAQSVLVVQAHGPTRWALEANQHLFTHPDQLKIDFLERESVARAGVLVSPSALRR